LAQQKRRSFLFFRRKSTLHLKCSQFLRFN
jgi:hypothetical protein